MFRGANRQWRIQRFKTFIPAHIENDNLTDKDDSMADVTSDDTNENEEVESPLRNRETSENVDETNQDKKRRRVAEEDNNENCSGATAAYTPKLTTVSVDSLHFDWDGFGWGIVIGRVGLCSVTSQSPSFPIPSDGMG